MSNDEKNDPRPSPPPSPPPDKMPSTQGDVPGPPSSLEQPGRETQSSSQTGSEIDFTNYDKSKMIRDIENAGQKSEIEASGPANPPQPPRESGRSGLQSMDFLTEYQWPFLSSNGFLPSDPVSTVPSPREAYRDGLNRYSACTPQSSPNPSLGEQLGSQNAGRALAPPALDLGRRDVSNNSSARFRSSTIPSSPPAADDDKTWYNDLIGAHTDGDGCFKFPCPRFQSLVVLTDTKLGLEHAKLGTQAILGFEQPLRGSRAYESSPSPCPIGIRGDNTDMPSSIEPCDQDDSVKTGDIRGV